MSSTPKDRFLWCGGHSPLNRESPDLKLTTDATEYNISPIAPGFELRAILASVQGHAVYDCLSRSSGQKGFKNEESSRPASVISPERVYSTAKLVNLVPLIISQGRLEDNPAIWGKIDLSRLPLFGSVTEDIPDQDFQRTKYSTFTNGNQVFFRGFDLANLPTPGKQSMDWSLIQCAECELGNSRPEDMQIFRVLTKGGQPLPGCGRHTTKYTAQFWVYVNPKATRIPLEFKKPFCKTVPEPLVLEPLAAKDLGNE